MKLKHIIVVLMAACMTVATVEAKGTGSCKERQAKECAKDCKQVCGEACTCGQKQQGCKKDCTKSEGQSCPGKKQGKGKGSCQK